MKWRLVLPPAATMSSPPPLRFRAALPRRAWFAVSAWGAEIPLNRRLLEPAVPFPLALQRVAPSRDDPASARFPLLRLRVSRPVSLACCPKDFLGFRQSPSLTTTQSCHEIVSRQSETIAVCAVDNGDIGTRSALVGLHLFSVTRLHRRGHHVEAFVAVGAAELCDGHFSALCEDEFACASL